MKNRLTDLNDHLFTRLECLSSKDTTGEKLKEEIERSRTVCQLAANIINNANLALKAQQMKSEAGNMKLPVMLEDK